MSSRYALITILTRTTMGKVFPTFIDNRIWGQIVRTSKISEYESLNYVLNQFQVLQK